MMSRRLPRLLGLIDEELLPDPAWFAEAKRRALTLIKELATLEKAWMFVVDRPVSHGSHVRDTGIASFNDIDYIVLLDRHSLRTLDNRERSAADTITRLAREMRDRRAGLISQGVLDVRAQRHSVGVHYPASRLRVDLVPALEAGEQGCYLIPDRVVDTWIETRPHRLKRRLTAAEHLSPQVRAAIRLIKGWRRARGKAVRFPSYAVELVLTELANSEKTLMGLVQRFFTDVATADARRALVLLGTSDRRAVTVRDPWSNVNVADELEAEHRHRLIDNAQRALNDLERAGQLADAGRETGALGVLRQVFKGNYV